MGDDEKKRSMLLCGLLASLLRGRLLTVLRGVSENNGYEALRQLVFQCQPTSRNRSLGILNALMGWKDPSHEIRTLGPDRQARGGVQRV